MINWIISVKRKLFKHVWGILQNRIMFLVLFLLEKIQESRLPKRLHDWLQIEAILNNKREFLKVGVRCSFKKTFEYFIEGIKLFLKKFLHLNR